MRQMIGVVKYTCDFCEFTITKPSTTVSQLPAGWDIRSDIQGHGKLYDRCPQCREQNARK